MVLCETKSRCGAKNIFEGFVSQISALPSRDNQHCDSRLHREKVRHCESPVFMRVPRTRENARSGSGEREVEDRRRSLSPSEGRVTEMRNLMRVFFLTIFFRDSIQRTNCDDVMSQ